MGCAGMVCIYMRCVTCISSCVDVRVYVCARQFERGHMDGLWRGWNVLLVESRACKSQTRARTRACKHTHKGHNFVFPDPYLPSLTSYIIENARQRKKTQRKEIAVVHSRNGNASVLHHHHERGVQQYISSSRSTHSLSVSKYLIYRH